MSIRALLPVGRSVSLADQVYSSLRALLRSGDLGPGQPLQEVALAAQLGVSRTPVREALARLASEGLLTGDGRTLTVPALTRSDIDDIYELRCLMEPAAMRRVAPRAVEPAARAALEAALAAVARAHRHDDGDAFRAAHAAHRAAWLALLPNRRMVRMIELYADHLVQIRALTLDCAVVRAMVYRSLERITAALIAGDGEAAAEAMRAHLQPAKTEFLRALGLDEAPEQRAPQCSSAKPGRVRNRGRSPQTA